jgi:hypothetical protein
MQAEIALSLLIDRLMFRIPHITTCEKKNVFLLIEIFRKLFNAQNYGHLDQLHVAISYLSGFVRIMRFVQWATLKAIREDI